MNAKYMPAVRNSTEISWRTTFAALAEKCVIPGHIKLPKHDIWPFHQEGCTGRLIEFLDRFTLKNPDVQHVLIMC